MTSAPPAADLAAILAELAALRARVAALEAAGPLRDRADARLLETLAISTRGLRFRARDLLAHARVDDALGAALEAAGLQSVDELGAWLRDRRGVHGDIVVTRHGRRWTVTRDTSRT